MKCPRLHGTLEPVLLNADYSSPLQAYMCRECHGVWMRALECRAYLGLECEKLVNQAETSGVDLPCPHCQTISKLVSVTLENGEKIEFHICPRCFSCFFDAVQFALIFYLQLKAERAISGLLAQSPLDKLGVECCDCGAIINNLEDLYEAGIGYCCSNCHGAPPVLSENKLQNVQLVTWHGMEIKIDHWQMSTRSRISVTPVEPCLLDVCLSSLSPIQRFYRFGQRKLKLHGNLGRHLDATEDISHITPWHVFLKQRGVAENLNSLIKLGSIELTFKPHCLIFELNAKRSGSETRQKFESSVRRLLIAYERFVELSRRYSMEDEEQSSAESSPDSLS